MNKNIPTKNKNLGIVGYHKKPDDYIELVNSNGIVIGGKCEIQGARYSQEDALEIVSIEVKDFKELPGKSREQVLFKTMEQMQTRHGQSLHVGTTACATVAWIANELQNDKKIFNAYTANLGDSTAFVVIVNKKMCRFVQRLNTLLHNPAPGNTEYDRVLKEGHQPYFSGLWRIPSPSGLAITRTIGDRSAEPYGLNHDTDVYDFQQDLQEDDSVFIVVACDGLTEGDVLDEAAIGDLVAKYATKTPDKIATALVNAAYNNGDGSMDNISVAVAKVTDHPVSAAVFDGHGGDEVAKNLGRDFYSTLMENIQLAH